MKIGTQAPIDLKTTPAKFHKTLKYGSKDIMSLISWEGLLLHYYIYKLISYKPDFGFHSNFAGFVYLLPTTCIPNKKKIHILLLPSAYVNQLNITTKIIGKG